MYPPAARVIVHPDNWRGAPPTTMCGENIRAAATGAVIPGRNSDRPVGLMRAGGRLLAARAILSSFPIFTAVQQSHGLHKSSRFYRLRRWYIVRCRSYRLKAPSSQPDQSGET
jgi:hypothetical protein